MPDKQQFDLLIIGSGEAGKNLSLGGGQSRTAHGCRRTEADRRIVSEYSVFAKQERHLQRKK
jgi:hypothetical protein